MLAKEAQYKYPLPDRTSQLRWEIECYLFMNALLNTSKVNSVEVDVHLLKKYQATQSVFQISGASL